MSQDESDLNLDEVRLRLTEIHSHLKQIDRDMTTLSLTKSKLEREQDSLKRVLTPFIPPPPKWIKVPQDAACWRCKRNTEWRNLHGAPEHYNGNCPYQESETTRIMRGLMNGDINVDELLKEQTK